MTRRDQVLDAAIGLLGDEGVRAVTHRAVDAAAGLPAGSTSNLFRTRDALFEGIVERFSARERAVWERLVEESEPPDTAAALAALMAELAVRATREHRTLELARYGVLLEAARRPSLRRLLAPAGRRVDAWFESTLVKAGSLDVDRDRHLLFNYWTGLVLHELAIPDPAFDPAARITALLTSLLAPRE